MASDGDTIKAKQGTMIGGIEESSPLDKLRVPKLDSNGWWYVNSYVTNGTVTNYVPNAMSPTKHRENSGGYLRGWPSGYVRDSTGCIPLNGGRRVELWFNMLPDTTAATMIDSTCLAINWFALGVRSCLTESPDSVSTAPWLPLFQPTSAVAGLPLGVVMTDYRTMVIGKSPTLYDSTGVTPPLLPGEVLVGLQCNYFSGAAGHHTGIGQFPVDPAALGGVDGGGAAEPPPGPVTTRPEGHVHRPRLADQHPPSWILLSSTHNTTWPWPPPLPATSIWLPPPTKPRSCCARIFWKHVTTSPWC